MSKSSKKQQDSGPKCLSMWQPFASLAVLGIKTLESRGFKVPRDYEGTLFIHASAKIPYNEVYKDYYLGSDAFRLIVNFLFFFGRTQGIKPVSWDIFRKAFVTGAILGHVQLGKSMPSWDLKKHWEERDGINALDNWDREFALGDHGSNRWAWPLSEPIQLAYPIPAKGTISPLLWNPGPQIEGCDLSDIRAPRNEAYYNDTFRIIAKAMESLKSKQ